MISTSSKSTGSDASRPASTMAELMAKHGKDLGTFTKGQEITGVITALSAHDIIMQVDGKTDVQVMEKERRLYKQLLELVHVGDTVVATILYPESDSGYPVASLRKFMDSKMWEQLEKMQKSGEKLPVLVTDSTKGGLLVEADNGMQGFLPNSHIAPGVKAEGLVGEKIQVTIAEIVKDSRKVVFSQKETLTPDDFKQIAQQYKAGTKVQGTVSGITQFGIFVSLPYRRLTGLQEQIPHPNPLPQGARETKEENTSMVDGLVHISEISWEKVEDLSSLFHMGETVEAVVIGMDPRSKRIDLSMKKLSKDPFQEVVESFPVDKKITGIVKEMTELGLVVDLGAVGDTEVEGLIKKDKIPPTVTYQPGQKVTATVVSIDSRRRKVMLTPVLLEKPLMYR